MRPIYDALNNDRLTNQIQFHMPGHLRGRGFENFVLSPKMDVTELFETDDLHSPEGVIKDSQDYAAHVFGAKQAYYMVNGSTGGIEAMVLGFLNEGDKIIADRFCHKSFVSALALLGAEPIWVYPKILESGLMWSGLTPEAVEAAIIENPDAKAVYITAPNYFGLMEDVQKISEITHKNNMYLLVDGAHGAHYGFYHKLPPSLISLGADAVALSLHKTLPALTQSSILLTNKRYDRVEAALHITQTSSPSYLIMASCENAVQYCDKVSKLHWDNLYNSVQRYFPCQIKKYCNSVKHYDFTRINIETSGNSFKVAEILRKEYSIAVECAYGGGVIAILNAFHTENDISLLASAAKNINLPDARKIGFAPTESDISLSPREAFFAKKKLVSLDEAEGKISADGLMVYPPGVYQVLPGQVITRAAIEQIKTVNALGGSVPQLKNSQCAIIA